jgi:predicted alpha/beta hydrolase
VTEAIETRTADGWVLRGELHRAAGEPRAVAVLGHAMWVDRRTLDRPRGAGLASLLAEQGVTALSFDLRAHGQSRPTVREGARYTYDEFIRYDVPAMVAEGRRRAGGRPVVVVGHSLTGHSAMIASGLWPGLAPDAIAALAANLWLPRFEPHRARRWLKGGAMALWVAMTAPVGRFDAPALRMGTAAEPWDYVRHYARMYMGDRLVSADGGTDYLDALARVRVPILSISSEGDRLMAAPADVDRFLASMPHAPVTRRVVTRGEMDPPPGHMGLVLSSRSRPLWREIADWIKDPPRHAC